MHVLAHLTLERRHRIKNSKGQGHFEKGHLKKRARGVDFLGGHPRPFKKGSKSSNSNNYFPMGHIHRITTGHQGHLFLALSVHIFGRASRPFLRASEAMADDGLRWPWINLRPESVQI